MPGLDDPPHPVALEQQRQTGDVVLVRVRQDDRVDPPVPRRDPPVERDEQPVGIGAAVDEQPPAARALDEDRVALPDIEDRDPGDAARPADDDGARRPRRRSTRVMVASLGTASRVGPERTRVRGAAIGPIGGSAATARRGVASLATGRDDRR